MSVSLVLPLSTHSLCIFLSDLRSCFVPPRQGIPLSVGSWFGGPRLVVEVAPAGSGGWLPKQRRRAARHAGRDAARRISEVPGRMWRGCLVRRVDAANGMLGWRRRKRRRS